MKTTLILTGLLLFGLTLWGSQWCATGPLVVTPNKIEIALQKAQLETHFRQDMLLKIRNYIESQPFHSERERMDFVRDWVHRDSIHKIDAEHDEYASDTPRVLFMLWHSYQTSRDYPHLSCGPRTNAMRAILDNLGIPNRIIVIFADDHSEIKGHTFLEAFDRQAQNWEVEDPDFDISYIDIHNRKRVPAAGLIWNDLNSVIPVSPTKKGWKQNHVSLLKRNYFKAMMFVNAWEGSKSVILINLDRFVADKFFQENEVTSFYKFACEHYGYPILITAHGSKLERWDKNSGTAIRAYFNGPDESVPYPHFYQ